MRRVLQHVVLFALLAPGLLGATRGEDLGDVVDVRHWSYDSYTRVVVELTRPAETHVEELGANTDAGLPPRLYLDLPEVWVGRSYGDPIPVGDGLLRRVRVGQNTLRKTRVVVDLERYDHHRLLVLTDPDRIVLDVFGEPRRAARSAPAPGSTGPGTERARVHTVVVDAGHGGKDPGAVGVGGLHEKDVTLALARELGGRLERAGFRVVLTRDDDRYLSLLERTAVAEGRGGDLFVSLHANAARRRSAQGVEIYTLQRDAERQTLRLAARENGVSPRQVDPLQRVLAQLQISETSADSERLASLVHAQISGDMGRRWRSVSQPALKQGPFYVLYLSAMPAILVEVGFVTNADDARRLRSKDYLAAMAGEIADGIVAYRDHAVVAGLWE